MPEVDSEPDRAADPGSPEPEARSTPPARRPLRWRRIALAVGVLVVIAIAGTLIYRAVAAGSNAAACHSFSRVYATYISAVEASRKSGDGSTLRAAAGRLPAAISRAEGSSSGPVRDALVSARTAAASEAAHPTRIAGYVAFFREAGHVADACAASGAPIRLKALDSTP